MNPLVTTSWLAGRLHDPGVVILDATLPPVGVTPPVDTRARYIAQHIPGAIFFDIEELSDRSNPLPHMLPPPDVFSRSLSALGIGDEMDIIIYEQEGVFSGPRAWWMLKTAGAQNVYLLDGGLRAWIEAGLPTDSGAFAALSQLSRHTRPRCGERLLPDAADDRGARANSGRPLGRTLRRHLTGAAARHKLRTYARSYQHSFHGTG